MLSIRELEVATRSTSEDVKAIADNVVKMEGSLERQTGAVVNLAETMGLALETLREVLDEQDSIKRRLSALEQDLAELGAETALIIEETDQVSTTWSVSCEAPRYAFLPNLIRSRRWLRP